MNEQASYQILDAILERAQKPLSEFRYIESWIDYRYCKDFKKATKIIIRVLRETSDKVLKSYCASVIAGISDVTQLLAFSQLQDVTTFYETELNTVDKMLADYKEYLDDGNLLYALLGGDRFHDSF